MKLYHDGENASLAEGRIVGSMQPTKQRPAIAADGDGAVPAKYNALLIEENDRIVFKGTFEQNQEAALSLHGTGETRQYAIPTAKLNATMAGSFLKEKDDPTNTWVSVNKEGLAGAYDVCLVADGKRYKTGISITV